MTSIEGPTASGGAFLPRSMELDEGSREREKFGIPVSNPGLHGPRSRNDRNPYGDILIVVLAIIPISLDLKPQRRHSYSRVSWVQTP